MTCGWAARNLPKNEKESVSASSVRRIRASGGAKRWSASNAGTIRVAKARIEGSAKRRAQLKGESRENGTPGS